jgi:hypothetical protein
MNSVPLCSYCDEPGHTGPGRDCPLWWYEHHPVLLTGEPDQLLKEPPPLCSYCLVWFHTSDECPNLED